VTRGGAENLFSGQGFIDKISIYCYLASVRCFFMCALYRNKYRVESARLKGYDYSSEGIYFVTICTQNFIPYFGHIESGRMIISGYGEIVTKFWIEIPFHFPSVRLDEFVVMPEHVHGIIFLQKKNEIPVGTPESGVSTTSQNNGPNVGTPESGVPTLEPS
jgi:REP element-mobilizing transposase RayT